MQLQIRLIGLVLLLLSTTEARAFYRIALIGDSIGIGYGLKAEDASFVRLMTRELQAARPDVRVVNQSKGGFSLAAADRQIDLLMNFSGRPAVYIIELGGNDYLAKVPAAEAAAKLRNICATIKRRFPKTLILIVGFGYINDKATVYEAVAREFGAISLTQFDWESAAGNDFRQPDGIHPTEIAHREIAKQVIGALLPAVSKADGPSSHAVSNALK